MDLGALGPEQAVRTTSLGMRLQILRCRNPILSGFILLFLSLFPSRAHHMHHSFSSEPQEEVLKRSSTLHVRFLVTITSLRVKA